jgi:hypothetical protein
VLAGGLVLTAVGIYAAPKIVRGIDNLYQQFWGGPAAFLPGGAFVAGETWVPQTVPAGGTFYADVPGALAALAGQTIWVLATRTGTSGSNVAIPYGGGTDNVNGTTFWDHTVTSSDQCISGWACNTNQLEVRDGDNQKGQAIWNQYAGQAGVQSVNIGTNADRPLAVGKTTGVWILYMTATAFDHMVIHTPPVPFTNQATTSSYTMSPAAAGSLTPTQLDSARTIIKSDPTTETWVNNQLSPGTAPSPASFVLPEPYHNETAVTYRDRLRALGFLGAIKLQDAPMPYASGKPAAALDPGYIIEVDPVKPDGTPDDVPRYDPDGEPIDWPDAPPVLDPETWPEIDIQKVPDSYAPYPETSGEPLPHDDPEPENRPPDKPVPDKGKCGVDVPPLDVTPLTGLDMGSKFPFGLIVWAKDGITGWGGTAAAPTFDVPVLWKPADSTAVDHWPLDLHVIDPFMPVFREMLVIMATFAGIWAVGTQLLGWGAKDEQLSLF